MVIAGTDDWSAGVALAEGGTLEALTVLMWNVPNYQLRPDEGDSAHIGVNLMILPLLTPIALSGQEHLESKLGGRLGAECQLGLG
jgi:hypothetical protein